MEQQTILAVDDTRANLDVLVAMLGDYYDVAVATDGPTALDMAARFRPDLILLDIMMPGMDGYAVLSRLKEDPRTVDIPVLLVSALSDAHDKAHGLALGAVDYVSKPFEMEELLARVRMHLLLVQTQRRLREHNENLERLVRERTKELLRIQQATIESMAALAEYRDPETGEHIQRVQAYVEHIATAARRLPQFAEVIDEDFIESLVLSSPLHDIGKVGIPDAILLKAGPLSTEEFEAMKRHTLLGREVICRVEKKLGSIPFLQVAKDVACYHHENGMEPAIPKDCVVRPSRFRRASWPWPTCMTPSSAAGCTSRLFPIPRPWLSSPKAAASISIPCSRTFSLPSTRPCGTSPCATRSPRSSERLCCSKHFRTISVVLSPCPWGVAGYCYFWRWR